jgi:hypothetical protein
MNLQEEINNLFFNQLNNWEQLHHAIEQLDTVKSKQLKWNDGSSVTIQYNPARITSTSASVDNKKLSKRPCFLCEENRPIEQQCISFLSKYVILCNPFPILQNHLTIALHSHVPQRVRNKIGDILTLTEQLDEYIVFYNGPKCGASAPDHFHIQAGLKSEVLKQGYNDLRTCMMINSDNRDEAIELFEEVYQYLSSLQPDENEPMINIISYYEKGMYNINIFPRKQHRPTQYYDERNEKLLISPGALDMAGLLITVREEDFKKIDKSDIEDIYNQVSLPII